MKATIKRARSGVLGAVLLFALAGCAPDPSDLASSPGTAGTTASTTAATVASTGVVVKINVIDNNFRPQASTAKVGDTVEFTNKGKNDHNVLPQSGTGWGMDTAGFHPGDVYGHVFTAPGVYAFYCSIHGTNKVGMVGTITVTE
ncbi:unannotated protein [freshwater metagenome]|uniref:Unannotated protein n=1 Tax=freshwater metagenome TaxID=449393 RepID=A0A6J7E2X7_9ZZZZ